MTTGEGGRAAGAGAEILTLAPDEISRFLLRARREQDAERWEVRLDHHLREILEQANAFVPSAAGSLLLDDPRAKWSGAHSANRLTFIACFGARARHILGTRLEIDHGIAGWIYRTGQPYVSSDVRVDELFNPDVDARSGYRTESIVGVPVVVGHSICGVMELCNRSGGAGYTPRDLELLRTFAGYASSSIQNALDAIRARELARRDDLTGLFNDRYLHRRLREELLRCEAESLSLSLLFIDLDDFKRINDRHGHLAGSGTLREAGALIADHIPPGAVAARYGGDEFVAILGGADALRAARAAEGLRAAVADAVFLDREGLDGSPPLALRGVTCSIGVASYHEHIAPWGPSERRQNALLRLADSAMYRAKGLGKNRVEVAEPEP